MRLGVKLTDACTRASKDFNFDKKLTLNFARTMLKTYNITEADLVKDFDGFDRSRKGGFVLQMFSLHPKYVEFKK